MTEVGALLLSANTTASTTTTFEGGCRLTCLSRWIFGPGNGREDRRVASCPFGFRRSAPDPSRDRKISPYSGHAIEKEGKSAKNSVFGAEPISPLQLQNDAQNVNFGPQSHLNMKLNPRRMLFRSMMTPKGSELIKNLTSVHENGGARKMWCFSIFLIFSI